MIGGIYLKGNNRIVSKRMVDSIVFDLEEMQQGDLFLLYKVCKDMDYAQSDMDFLRANGFLCPNGKLNEECCDIASASLVQIGDLMYVDPEPYNFLFDPWVKANYYQTEIDNAVSR